MPLLRALALAAAVAAALLLAASGPGTRADLWTFGTGFRMLRWGAYAGLAAAALALAALAVPRARARGVALPLLALVLGLGAAWMPWRWTQRAAAVPPIHDVTTDPDDPPAFVDILPRRAGAPNPPEYAGAETAAAQRRAYPDLVPVELPVPPPVAFARARDAATAMGWELVAADSAEGRVEATATTRWFGFRDDVVVRVRPSATGSRVDVRSKSRVGRSDVGTNAARIRAFVARLR